MNVRHQQFVNEYLKTWNATTAYLRSYPNASYETAGRNGHVLLKNTEISEAIQQRITENAMSADEVLARLGDHARGSMGDFVRVTDNKPVFDFQSASDNGRLHLVKRLKTKTKTYVQSGDEDDESSVNEVDVEFELYDAQAALVHLGRHHKLFTDRTETDATITHDVSDPVRQILSRINRTAARIGATAGHLGNSSDSGGTEAS